MAGLGLSLISAHTIASEVADGPLTVLRVEGLPIVQQWFVVRRSNRELPPGAAHCGRLSQKREIAFCRSAGPGRRSTRHPDGIAGEQPVDETHLVNNEETEA